MGLYQLLSERREDILAKCRTKIIVVLGPLASSYQLDQGLETLYDEVAEVMRISFDTDTSDIRNKSVIATMTSSPSKQQAQESYTLGFTVGQLVHCYGSICQGITEFAHEAGAPITSAEFSQLNLCLDVAIAQAVSEFADLGRVEAGKAESLRLGFLAHELRNYLSSAMMAHELIKSGTVAAAGATSSILTSAHLHMKDIIDRSVAEVRMGNDPIVNLVPLQLLGILSEVEGTLLAEAKVKSVTLRIEADPKLFVMADRHLMVAALANIVQNAVKYTKRRSHVRVQAYPDYDEAVVEVEDRCGGLLPGLIEAMFDPYVQGNKDQSGLGLGLSIARRAINLNGGRLTAHNRPKIGCQFSIRMPKHSMKPPATPVGQQIL